MVRRVRCLGRRLPQQYLKPGPEPRLERRAHRGRPRALQQDRTNFAGNDRVHPLCALVGFKDGVDTIDVLLSQTPIPRDFDLISIDVDGVDWHIWDSIRGYRPRVVVIEFNPTVPNDVVFIQDKDMGINEGCSLAALVELGKSKGYELVATTNGNAFFVVAEEFAQLGIADNSVAALRLDRRNYVFNCYNGKIYHTMNRLSWYGKTYELRPDSLQFLSEFRFGGRSQGRAGRPDGSAQTSCGGPNLSTADGLVREIVALRAGRQSLDNDEMNKRRRAVWLAADAYVRRHAEYVDPDALPTVEDRSVPPSAPPIVPHPIEEVPVHRKRWNLWRGMPSIARSLRLLS